MSKKGAGDSHLFWQCDLLAQDFDMSNWAAIGAVWTEIAGRSFSPLHQASTSAV